MGPIMKVIWIVAILSGAASGLWVAFGGHGPSVIAGLMIGLASADAINTAIRKYDGR